MKQYIDKSTLIAEIEKRIRETESMQPKFDQFWAGQISAFKGILKNLNTLEVKEVDLEKEIDKWYNNEASKEFENVLYKDIEKCAKHFFELGLKAQVKSVWHEYNETIDVNRPFLHISKKGHLSIMQWNGQSLKSMTFGCDSCCVICKGDKFAYIDEL